MTDAGNALAELEPEGLAAADASWQERKRADFRMTVLDAVITCLAEHGYARTTSELVAATARVSRGTMIHRFPTKQDLIVAAIDYAFFRRMENYLRDIGSLTDEERINQNLGISVSWKHYFTKEYKAYLELHVAARTDKELREIFIPRAKRYDRIWRREVARAFPEWAKDKDLLDRSGEFVRATLEGLALNSDIWDNAEHQAALLNFVTSTLIMIRDKKLEFPRPKKAAKNPA